MPYFLLFSQFRYLPPSLVPQLAVNQAEEKSPTAQRDLVEMGCKKRKVKLELPQTPLLTSTQGRHQSLVLS